MDMMVLLFSVYGVFFLAEQEYIQVSGVLAVVFLGFYYVAASTEKRCVDPHSVHSILGFHRNVLE